MKRFLLLVFSGLLLAGCDGRVPLYSPRLQPSPAHLEANRPEQCRACHQVAGIPNHHADDQCLRCHAVCRGCL